MSKVIIAEFYSRDTATLLKDRITNELKNYNSNKLKIRNQKNGSEVTYTLVAQNEANLAAKKISIDSPIGKGLLGKSVGDIAEIEIPAGVLLFEILEISR